MHRSLFLLLAAALLAGCASDPRQASTLQLALGLTSPIKKRLDERRAVLAGLRRQVGRLDQRIAGELARLRRIQHTRDIAAGIEAGSAAARREAEDKIAKRRAEGERLASEISDAQREIHRLESDRVEADDERASNDRRTNALKGEVQHLERQVEFYEGLNAETVRETSRNSLRE